MVKKINNLKENIELENLILDILNQKLHSINYNILIAALKAVTNEYKDTPLYYKKITKCLENLANDGKIMYIVNSFKNCGDISLTTINNAAFRRHKEHINNSMNLSNTIACTFLNSYTVSRVDVPTRRELLKRVKTARAKYMEYEKTLRELKDLKSCISDLMSGATKSFYGLGK